MNSLASCAAVAEQSVISRQRPLATAFYQLVFVISRLARQT
jgi:hypothetical protein